MSEPVHQGFDDQGRLRFGDIELVRDISPPPRRPSQPGSFTLVKTAAFLDYYSKLAIGFKPSGVLELGIYQGGSYVLFDQLLKPRAISAIDKCEPVAPLVDYAAARDRRYLHFGQSQSDGALLARIVSEELEGRLDLVIDDASHNYALTKASFEVLFPLLTPGGYYVIEDWAWSHAPANQAPDAPRAGMPALTNLVFELVVLLGSTRLIASIDMTRSWITIRKSDQARDVGNPGAELWERLLTRGQPLPRI